MTREFYIGTSGWVYQHWRGVFYPEGLAQSRWLDFYCRHFSTVELNNSFYHLPSEKAFHGWRDATPAGFRFAVKASRFITHIKRLKDVAEPLRNFLGRAVLLREKLGPVLYQLPPNMKCRPDLLEGFLKTLPPGLEHVFEFRHPSWFCEEVFALLHSYNAGFCIFDMPGLTTPFVATADFGYIRFHGSQYLYGGCYSDEELARWAGMIGGFPPEVRRVYIYFNNDAQGFAVRNALSLGRMLGASR